VCLEGRAVKAFGAVLEKGEEPVSHSELSQPFLRLSDNRSIDPLNDRFICPKRAGPDAINR
jgi:hypothetical protein